MTDAYAFVTASEKNERKFKWQYQTLKGSTPFFFFFGAELRKDLSCFQLWNRGTDRNVAAGKNSCRS